MRVNFSWARDWNNGLSVISAHCKRALPSAHGEMPRIFGAAIFDQGLNSASTLLLTVIAARISGIDGLGRLAVVATVVFVSLSLARTLIMEPMLLVSKDRGHRVAPHALIATCCGFSVTSCWVVIAVTGDVVASAYGAVLTSLAIIQDFTRYAGFRQGTTKPALRSDLTVLIGTLIGGGLANLVVQRQANLILAVWVAALACGVLVNISHLRWQKARTHDICWRRDMYHYSRFLAPDSIAFLGGSQITLLILASAGGESQAATARAALTLLAPLGLVFTAVSVLLTPRWVAISDDATRLLREVWKASFIVGSLAGFLTGFLVLTSSWLPELVFGPDIHLQPFGLGVAGLSLICLGAGSPFLILAKIHNALRPVIVIRSTSAAAALLLMSTVEGLQVANGYFLLIAAQALLSLLILLKMARLVSRRLKVRDESESPLPDEPMTSPDG
jgi:hypothetical protein